MRIYVAGPYTKGDVKKNVEKAIFFGDWIAAFGHAVFIPHLTHFWDEQIPHEWEFWMNQDFEWLTVCDAVFRIDGESKGADMEVELAKKLGKPVYTDIAQIAALPKPEKMAGIP
jgi:hypothetical protein